MSMSYENQRVHFDKIVEQYMSYLRMYKILNRGSTDGIVSFAFFYWQQVYFTKHDDNNHFDRGY